LSTAVATFAAIACSDLEEQQQELRRLASRARELELTPITAQSAADPTGSYLFTLSGADGPVAVAAGFIKKGRTVQSLEGVLLRGAPGDQALWEGLRNFAREQGLSQVSMEAIDGVPEIPRLAGESDRGDRTVWPIDLADTNLDTALAKNHRRNVRRAQRLGVEVSCSRDEEAIEDHLRLCRASLARRAERGEIPDLNEDRALLRRLLSSGRATFYRALMGEHVHSSDLVTRIGDAAWYMSGGSDPEGMKLGTSHLLMLGIARELQTAGCRTLNLGASDEPGLSRFKLGFGARPVKIVRVTLEWGAPVARLKRRAVRALARLRGRG
jgi:hypothetical protein